MTTEQTRQEGVRLADDTPHELADYVRRVVATAPPLSEAPVEAEAAIRALGAHPCAQSGVPDRRAS